MRRALIGTLAAALLWAPGALAITKTDATLTASDGVTLAYSLYVPDGTGPFPAVMLFHGLGQTRAAEDSFARALNHAEARAELRHMANIHKASQDDKNWRTSVWWLEQRAAARAAQSSDADHGKMTAKMLRTPKLSDVPYAVQMQPHLIVEFYSR